MRRNVLKRGQSICLFCALRAGLEPGYVAPQSAAHVRRYRSSASSWRPAGAAAARREEDEDDSEYQSIENYTPQYRYPPQAQRQPVQSTSSARSSLNPGWTCRCGHTNQFEQHQCPSCWSPQPGRQTPIRHQNVPRSRYDHASSVTLSQNERNTRSRYESAFKRDSVEQNVNDTRQDLFRYTKFGKSREKSNQPNQEQRSPGRGEQFNQRGEPADQKSPLRIRFHAGRQYDEQPTINKPEPPVRNHKPQPSSSLFRSINTSGTGVFGANELEAMIDRPPTQPRREPRQRQYQDFPPRRDFEERTGTQRTTREVKPSEISVEPSIAEENPPENDSLESFGRHRGVRKVDSVKSRRSQVYEVDVEDVEDMVLNTTQKGTRVHKAGISRNRGRRSDTDFDFDAAEAELFGEESRRRKKRTAKRAKSTEEQLTRPQVQIPEFVSVENLAQSLKVKTDTFIQKLEEEGFEGARYDHVLDASTSAMLADLYGFDPIVYDTASGTDLVARPPAPDPSILPSRPPIVTIMGHVDHGKTTILDWLRKSSVVETEHGGITQHIGAFSVTMPGTERQITFLDTPGHAAFLDMRKRGANVTDIVVLVVAADDSVKPQTIEAIKHALDAKVQIIVAINKIDKEEANLDRVKQDLARHDIVVEDYGGDYQAIPVSGKTGQGMADLEEAIITLADVLDLRAEDDGPAEGWVIESKVTQAGRVATVLVRRGTLRPGDFIVAGTTWGRVRTLRNDAGHLVQEAPPGTPVQVDGWRGADPAAGMEVLQADNEDHAKIVMESRLEMAELAQTATDLTAINAARSEEAEARAKVLAWEAEQEWAKLRVSRRPKDNEGWVEREDSSGQKKVHFIIKADVAGSAEALEAAVSAIGNNEIVANVIHCGVGLLSESDIRHLASTGEIGYAISFNQPVDGSIRRLAEAADLEILDHNIIYKVTDDVTEKLSVELPPLITQKVSGEAEVGQIFDVTVKKDKIKVAGCRVTNGTMTRNSKVRVLRKNEVVYTGILQSLKHVKRDVAEMRKGTECGMGFEGWEDFQEGDQVQCYEETSEKRKLY